MLKQVRYANGPGQGRAKNGIVNYAIRDKNCIFTGITNSEESATTVEAAECIINAIAEAEKLDPQQITFYDLCTRVGYPGMTMPYDLMMLEVEYRGARIHVTAWIRAACTPEILRLFSVVEH